MKRITDDYVSFETAKLLKEKGFKEMCEYLYGTAFMHNGRHIDEDEEFELNSEGRGDEIKLIEGGMIYNLWNRNDKRNKHECSRPSFNVVLNWLRIKHKLHIWVDIATITYSNTKYKTFYKFNVVEIDDFGKTWISTKDLKKSYSDVPDAYDAAIKFCLDKI